MIPGSMNVIGDVMIGFFKCAVAIWLYSDQSRAPRKRDSNDAERDRCKGSNRACGKHLHRQIDSLGK